VIVVVALWRWLMLLDFGCCDKSDNCMREKDWHCRERERETRAM
jgi:hypothetical protein